MTTSRHLMVRFLRQKEFVSHFKYIKQYNRGLYFARRYCTSHGIFSRNVMEALDRIMTEERVKLAPYNVECVFGHNSKRAITNALLYTVDRDFNYTNPVLIPEDQHHLYHSFATYFSDIYEEGFEHMRRFIVDGEQPPANLLPPIAALQTFFAEKEYHETCLKTLLTENDFKGAEESTILAIHLMSKLIYPSYAPYKISNEYLYKPKRCPCYDSHKCRRNVIYGNTGMDDIVAVKLEVSTERNAWNHLGKSCHPVDISWFCSVKDKTCVPDFVYSTDYTSLPDAFSAWINAYLIKSASIVYDGCFEVPKTFFLHLVKHTYTDITSCARICLSTVLVFYSYFGIQGTSCYCFLDSITAHNGIVDVSKTTLENSCLNHETSYMKVYKILKHRDLKKDRCPVAYPISTVVLYLENCHNNNTYYCSGEDTSDRVPTSWYQAVKHCAKMSTTLVNKFERGSNVRKYWTHSLQYNEYTLNEVLPLFETRCAALVRTNTEFIIKALNCSSLLPTLCQVEVSNKTGTSGTVSPYTSSELESNTDHVTWSTVALAKPTRNTSIVKTTDKGTNMSTTPTVFSITIATSKPNTETIAIVIPVIIVIVIVALVVGIVIYKRRARSLGDDNHLGGMEGGVEEVMPLNMLPTP